MEEFILAVKNNDLVSAKTVFNGLIKERVDEVIKEEQLKIARQVFVEGEELKGKDSDETEDTKETKETKETETEDSEDKK